jgi:ribonucleotide monophosphatase NagD (HAD superfamily)
MSAGWELAYDISEADILIARGTFTIVTSETIISNNRQSSGEYQEKLDDILTAAAKLRLPMLICNPDKVRPDESLSPMPGAIGDKYVKQLQLYSSLSLSDAQGLVKRIGKPYQEIYQLALASIEGCSEMARLGSLMVGDALETDVTGGLTLGCNTLWVIRDGIHGAQVAQHEEQLQGTSSAYEEAVLRVLKQFNDPTDFAAATSRMGQEGDMKSIIPTFAVQNFRWS